MHAVRGWTHSEMAGDLHCWETPQWQCDGLLTVHGRHLLSDWRGGNWEVGRGLCHKEKKNKSHDPQGKKKVFPVILCIAIYMSRVLL